MRIRQIKNVFLIGMIILCFLVFYVYATYTAYIYFSGQYVDFCEKFCREEGYASMDECFQHIFCEDNTTQIAVIGFVMNACLLVTVLMAFFDLGPIIFSEETEAKP